MTPLLQALFERISAWRAELGSQPPPSLRADLQEALSTAQATGIDPLLWIVIVGMCERWFRVYTPTLTGIERELRYRLSTANYSPYRDSGLSRSGTPSVLAGYVVHRLREHWDPEASDEMARSLRLALKDSVKTVARKLAVPFLVVGNRPLPRKPGKSPRWGPWAAAAALYADVRARFPRRQDSRALKVAMTLLKALSGKWPHKAEFRRKRRAIERLAPSLMENMVSELRTALKTYKERDWNPKWRVEYLLWSGTFDSPEEWGGMQLLVGPDKP